MDRAYEAKIEEGPTKHEFLATLGTVGVDEARAVRMTLRDEMAQYSSYIVIGGISREDGSGESFNFDGYHADSRRRVIGYYRTDKGTGWIAAELTPQLKAV